MPTDKPSRPRSANSASAQDTQGDTPHGAGSGDALGTWNSLVDDWWRQHSETLPDELRRTIQATLDQSKAMWLLACGLPAQNLEQTDDDSDAGSPVDPVIGLWQPVFRALRACEQIVLSGQPAPARAEEYALAYGAYVDEFAKLNVEVTRRIRDKLAQLDAHTGFVDLHRLILQEAEDAYLRQVSTDDFARCQARFVNALFRARAPRDRGDPVAGRREEA